MHILIPIRGPLAIPFRILGIKTSQMNPNLCTICETMFTKVKRKKQLVIPATILYTPFNEDSILGIRRILKRSSSHFALSSEHFCRLQEGGWHFLFRKPFVTV